MIAHGHTMTRDPARPSPETKAIVHIDAALSELIRLIAGQVAKDLAGIALDEEANDHGTEDQN